QPVDAAVGPAAQLQGAADTIVELTLRRGRRKDRTVAVIPLASEETLRYQDWVRSRREDVAEKAERGNGYVHIPAMAFHGWAQRPPQGPHGRRHPPGQRGDAALPGLGAITAGVRGREVGRTHRLRPHSRYGLLGLGTAAPRPASGDGLRRRHRRCPVQSGWAH